MAPIRVTAGAQLSSSLQTQPSSRGLGEEPVQLLVSGWGGSGMFLCLCLTASWLLSRPAAGPL